MQPSDYDMKTDSQSNNVKEHTGSDSEYGISRVNISKTVQPRLHISAGRP